MNALRGVGKWFCAMLGIGLMSLIVPAQVTAETWYGQAGGSDGNPTRESDPTFQIGAAWGTGDSMQVPGGGCVSYSDGVVFTSVGEFGLDTTTPVAFDATDGSRLWQGSTAQLEVGCPTPHQDQVVFTYRRESDHRSVMALLESDDGSVVWEHELPTSLEFLARQGVTLSDGKVFAYVRGHEGDSQVFDVRAFDLEDGAQVWSRPGLADVWATPLVADGAVLMPGTLDQGYDGFTAYDVEDGSNLNWTTSSLDDLSGALTRNGVVYYRHDTSSVQARALASGEVLWTRSLGSSYQVGQLVADDETLYVTARHRWTGTLPYRLSALDQSDGSDIWPARFMTDGRPPMHLLGGRLFIDAAWPLGERAVLDPSSGERLGTGTGFPADLAGHAYGDRSFFLWRSVDHPSPSPLSELVALREVTPPEIEIASLEDGEYQADRHELTWTGTDGSGVGIDRFEISVNGQIWATLPADRRAFQLAELPPGSNEISLTGIDLNENKTTATRQITVVPSPVPVAQIMPLPGSVLSGKEITLSAAESHDTVRDGGIVKYEWDVDGDGEFELDAGAVPTAKTHAAQVGRLELGLRVTNKFGNSATASRSVDVRRSRLPGAGAVGVSINDAEVFTNNPTVRLKLSWPEYASSVLISNDGGFSPEHTEDAALSADGILEWKLRPSGPERLPKTVYVRFSGTDSDAIIYTDDIILDQTPPVIELASVTGVAGASVASAGLFGVSASAKKKKPKKSKKSKKRKKPKKLRVRLKARDTTSGVVAVQVAKNKKVRGPVVRIGNRAKRVNKVINPRVKYRPRLIRVKDAAGNWSKFRRVK